MARPNTFPLIRESTKRHTWTKRQDDLLFDKINNKGFKNCTDIFEEVSVLLKISPRAVKQRWYLVVSKQSRCAYATGSEHGMLINRKTVSRKNGKMRMFTMKPMLFVIHELGRLSEEDRQIVIKIFSK